MPIMVVLIMTLNVNLQADGDLVSAVDFSTQYLVTGHEVMRPSFFGFLSEFVSAGAKPPTNIHKQTKFCQNPLFVLQYRMSRGLELTLT